MGDILGVGLSHYPPFSGRDEDMAAILRQALQDPAVPERETLVENWSELARREWGDDEGRTAAAEHRNALRRGFGRVRAELDAFEPDVVLIWGDDQYENFREDIIPPYAILAYEDMEVRPWAQAADSSAMKGRENVWGEGADTTRLVRGHPEVGKYLATKLLEAGIDVSYAYKPLHHPGLPHAFLNAILYLDYERIGFEYPVLPFPINCYGRRVVSYEGFYAPLDDVRDLDPPSATPQSLMRVGAHVARVLLDSPWRVALVASSSWSHAFICDHTWRLRPDTEEDKRLYDALVTGRVGEWERTPLADIERAGQQELLNWFPLVGAMAELGQSKPAWAEFVQTEIFNSNKVFTAYEICEQGQA